jgi:tight adherence protein B
MLKFTIFFFILGSVGLVSQAIIPPLMQYFARLRQKAEQRTSRSLEEMFVWRTDKRLGLIFRLSPVVIAGMLFILTGNPILAAGGVMLGLVLPRLVILRIMEKNRKKKFQAQILDALTSISHSLKAGLSFLQAIEVLVEELPAPISQEFALIVKENKMGISLEESFERLNEKMGLEDLNLMTTAILVARETGGSNLTEVFAHLGESIRERNKIGEQVKTLTTQARWQGIIMSVLPIVFALLIFNINPRFFEIMLVSDKGRLLLLWCVISEVIGAFLLIRLSNVEV